jgi:hypothetical protein
MQWRSKTPSMLLAAILFWPCAGRAAHVVTGSGRQINGVRLTASEEGAVTLTTASGQRLTFQPGQYREAVVERPAELDKAESLLSAGDGEAAVELLETVKQEYRFLAWDLEAVGMLARHYFAQKEFSRAAAELSAVDGSTDPDLRRLFMLALMKAGEDVRLMKTLQQEIAEGSREQAAFAYLIRSEWRTAAGEDAAAKRDALKLARFFSEQEATARAAREALKREVQDEE